MSILWLDFRELCAAHRTEISFDTYKKEESKFKSISSKTEVLALFSGDWTFLSGILQILNPWRTRTWIGCAPTYENDSICLFIAGAVYLVM